MDARTLLAEVAKAYQDLESLSVDIVCVNESGDEDNLGRSEQKSKAYYKKPDKIRLEQGGARGSIFVSDGAFLHHYIGGSFNRYSKEPLGGGRILVGWFRPELRLAGTDPVFLFHQIDQRVASAEILADPEPGVQAISVTYEGEIAPLLTSSPVTYYIDSQTHLVLRAEAQISHRIPVSDEIVSRKTTLLFRGVDAKGAILPELFEYAPPAGADDASVVRRREGISTGSGGRARLHRDKDKYLEEQHSSDWHGEMLVERYKLRLRGMDLSFERRLTFSEDGSELHIAERISGPKGQTQGDFTIPLGEKGTAKIE